MSIFIGFFGGMGLLLFGMYYMNMALQKVAGKKLREVLSSLTKNKVVALILGVLITVLFQSSTATTVILVSLTSVGMVSLRQTLGVILGSDIGTTITAQLIALKVTEISLPIIGLGAIIVFYFKRDRHRRYGEVLMGFGLLFLGLKIMGDTIAPIEQSEYFAIVMSSMANHPYLAMIAAAIFTFCLQSSAATVGIIMVMSMQEMIDLRLAIFFLMGANLGSCFTAILISLTSSREAQRVAAAHFIFKLSGVLLVVPVVTQFEQLIRMTTSSPGFQVANAHTIFNIGIALLFLPLINYFAKFLELIVPEKKVDKGAFEPRYLDEGILSSPSLAIGAVTKELLTVSHHVSDMVCSCHKMLTKYDTDEIERIESKERLVDSLTLSTKEYVTKILRKPLDKDEWNKAASQLSIVTQLEHIGDIVTNQILYKSRAKFGANVEFSQEGQKELDALHSKVCYFLKLTDNLLLSSDCNTIKQAYKIFDDIDDSAFRYKMSHIMRLADGVKETCDTTTIHEDVLNAYLHIANHLKKIVEYLDEEISCTLSDEAQIIGVKEMGV